MKKELLTIITLLILTIPVLLPLFKPGYFPTQDYIYVARIYEMKVALDDGHFPVRWVKDFRNGEPLYNFYAPLPYYIGSLLKFFPGLSYLVIIKILFGIGFILSTLAMFFLGKKLFGALGGFIAGLMYLYAPYHSVDVYVRGALSESWALIFFPLIFLSSLNLSEKKSIKNIAFLALSLAGLFYTHNVMTMISAPFILVWMAYLIYKTKDKSLIKNYLISIFWGIGISASFLLPAFFEKQFVKTDELTTGYFDFRGHFVAVRQWFSPFWGYGASLWGAKDDMSFQVGLTHWAGYILSALLAVLSFIQIRFSKINLLIFKSDLKIRLLKENFLLFVILSGLFVFSLFMMHNKSAFIWEWFEVLEFTQFPWRFLGISIFFISLISGYMALYLKANLVKGLVFLITLVVVLGNISYFHPDSYYLDSVDDHYISQNILSQNDKLPKDYLPIWVKKIRDEKIIVPHFIEGGGEIKNFNYKTAFVSFDVNTSSKSAVETPVTYFPGWEVKVNDKKIDLEEPDEYGLVKVPLTEGVSKVKMQFNDTGVRVVSNLISLLSLLILIFVFVRKIRSV